MEAHLLRICVSVAFVNIHFDSNALAPRHHRTYDTFETLLELILPGVKGVTVAFHWCFDGSVVALFPEPVHSPRHDDLHDRERGNVYLRGRNRPIGVGAVPYPTNTAPYSPQSRARPWRSLYGRHVRGRERRHRGRPRDRARSARNGAALGQAAVVAALLRPARQAIQLARPGEKQCRPPLRPRRAALFPLPRRRQAI